MFIPIYDHNPLRSIRFQGVTVALIVANVAIFALQVAGMPANVIISFAIVPIDLLGLGATVPAVVPSGDIAVPERLTLLSYMFFHGDILHLGVNMLFLWVFGDNVEDALGHVRFLFFYLACGVVAGLTHALMLPSSQLPLIGASGAVAGVIAAYLMLHPRVRVWVLVLRFIPIRITAAFALGAWIISQFIMVLLPQAGPIAWWAHIGGLVAGAILVVVMRRPGVRLFDREIA
ncbi:MAG: rhomboid family intramembrane serine protease [Hyphomicrobiaceae bacterium]|nr:rhomboid family intramembrane serine protease [Hyphomicrobiaceae bacterium]